MVSPVHGDYRRLQAETPLIVLFKFAEPALSAEAPLIEAEILFRQPGPAQKIAGTCFFVGVIAFAVGFALIQLAIFAHDEMLHSIRKNETLRVEANRNSSSRAMARANRLAMISALAFLAGLVAGLVALLSLPAAV
jgi:hypothetical protein